MKIYLGNNLLKKTTQFWHTFTTPSGSYLKMRRALFGRKSVSTLYREAKKFNRV